MKHFALWDVWLGIIAVSFHYLLMRHCISYNILIIFFLCVCVCSKSKSNTTVSLLVTRLAIYHDCCYNCLFFDISIFCMLIDLKAIYLHSYYLNITSPNLKQLQSYRVLMSATAVTITVLLFQFSVHEWLYSTWKALLQLSSISRTCMTAPELL